MTSSSNSVYAELAWIYGDGGVPSSSEVTMRPVVGRERKSLQVTSFPRSWLMLEQVLSNEAGQRSQRCMGKYEQCSRDPVGITANVLTLGQVA